jgi:hypothetical protein
MVFNATFNNISAISWRSVLLVEETGVPEKITDQSYINVNVIIFIDSIHIIKPKQRIKCYMCHIIYLS